VSISVEEIDYSGEPAGCASAPSEVVNQAESHGSRTLFDG